jgi:hypothetical protein
MVDPSVIELMHKEIDGMATQAEKAKLRRRMDKSKEARTMFEELRRTAELLHSVQPQNPPPHLQENILRSLRLVKSQGTSSQQTNVW